MAEIVNLRTARKRKVRAEKDEVAAANRAKFGQTKAERGKREAEEKLAARRLDGHLRGGD
jgi:hypothetical protein